MGRKSIRDKYWKFIRQALRSGQKLEEDLRLNEPGVGLIAYRIWGSFNGTQLSFDGEPISIIEVVELGKLQATAQLTQSGEFVGQWQSDIGAAGTFTLFPHDQNDIMRSDEAFARQLHTTRYAFGAIQIELSEIISLAEDVQKEFSKAPVIITFKIATAQSRFLEDFKRLSFNGSRANAIKIYAQQPERDGTSKVVSIEFGQDVNVAITQSSNEAWALGELEKIKESVRRHERLYATNVERFGFSFLNTLLIGATIAYLPSLGNLASRAVLFASVILLLSLVKWVHQRYLPFAAIYLDERSEGFIRRFGPSVISWVISATASLVAALVAAYLQGYLYLPE